MPKIYSTALALKMTLEVLSDYLGVVIARLPYPMAFVGRAPLV
jgi:hypothetical protein